jgi:GNAT superfamily N-acetyltransferase
MVLSNSEKAGCMSLTVERSDAREWPDEQMRLLYDGAFPPFITADKVAAQYIGRIREWFTDLYINLVDEDEVPVATGWGVPIRWSGEAADLPAGYTDTTRLAVEAREHGDACDTFVICGGIVRPDRTGRGLAGELIKALRDLAPPSGLGRVLAPVRPTLKPTYPLTPIETFAGWTRPDGAPLDPWLRTHWRLGGSIIATAPESQTMTGTVDEWQTWTGMQFPSTGEYVIPAGLSTLHIDRDGDRGTYTEPNVWVQHR